MYQYTYFVGLKTPYELQFNLNQLSYVIRIQDTELNIEPKLVVLCYSLNLNENYISRIKIIAHTNSQLNSNECHLLENKIKELHSDIDLASFYMDVKKDKILSKIVSQLYGMKYFTLIEPFEIIVRAICQQQLCKNTSSKIEQRLVEEFGSPITLNEHIYYAFPTPNVLARCTVRMLHSCGMSKNKARSILYLARRCVRNDIDLNALHKLPTAQIINELLNLRGIGIWSAQYIAMRGYGRYDELVISESLSKAMSYYYKPKRGMKKMNPVVIKKIADKWYKWKGLASYYITTAMKLDIEI